MTNHRSTQITGEDKAAIACDRPVLSDCSGDRRMSCEIILFPFPPRNAAAEWAWEEEASGPDTFQSIGSLAIRLVMRTKYPRIWCEVRGDEREEDPSPL